MKKLIFLDIDGVLNCQEAYEKGYCKFDDEFGQSFYPPAAEYLNKIIDATDADVVISSTWRNSGLEVMQNMWKSRGMSGKVIGVTPNFSRDIPGYSIPRGCEIEWFLEEVIGLHHIFWSKERQQEYIDRSGYDNYIIIDDDSDMLYNQRNHFINVHPSPRNTQGFNSYYYVEALRKLSKTIIDLNYD